MGQISGRKSVRPNPRETTPLGPHKTRSRRAQGRVTGPEVLRGPGSTASGGRAGARARVLRKRRDKGGNRSDGADLPRCGDRQSSLSYPFLRRTHTPTRPGVVTSAASIAGAAVAVVVAASAVVVPRTFFARSRR